MTTRTRTKEEGKQSSTGKTGHSSAKSQDRTARWPERGREHPGPGSKYHPVVHLQRNHGNQAVQRLVRSGAIRAKLRVNGPGDLYEQEADRVAEQVMRMSDPIANGRKVNSGQLEEEEEILQTREASGGTSEVSPNIEAQINSVRGGGQPLPKSVRNFFEPRFGADFGQVRVHTDDVAEQSAQDLNAHAYTVGRNIVFDAGSFAPGTQEGRRLLAHELTHVVQQGGREGSGHVQRKEIIGSVLDTRKPLPPQDWWSLHREEWQRVSATGKEQMLSPTNTFMRAAWYNTLNLRPDEYQTVTERHNYYDLISYVIEHDPGTPKAVRDVRFFHATTSVTGSPGIGSVDKPIGQIKLGADTRQILRDVNAELFALNMGVIRDLLFNWREPRDPQNPDDPINAFDFDIRMVETEQGAVENFIAQNEARFTASVVQEINATLDPNTFGQFFNFSKRALELASKALGVPTLDFTKREHRQAIGFAAVHIFHRKGEQDYLAFMNQRLASMRPTNQYVVANLNGVTLNEGLPGPLLTYDLPVGTAVKVIDWSHYMGPHRLNDVYAGKVEVQVLDGAQAGKTGWTDFANLE